MTPTGTGAERLNPEERDRIEARESSLGALFQSRITQTPHADAFLHPSADDTWLSMTWGEAGEIVYDVAAALLRLGIEREERVGIASNTRLEWILADLAIMCAGGATTTVYPTTSHSDVAFIIDDSGTRCAFLEDAEQLTKLREHDALYQNLRAVVLFDGSDPDERVYTWNEFRDMGRRHREENPSCVGDAIAGSRPEDLSTLIYTSGTTGQPKGVELTHDAWTYLAAAVRLRELMVRDDVHYLWLPLSHVFGKALIAIHVETGCVTAVDGRIERIVDGLGEVRPTVMCGAPRIFEKVRNKVMMTSNSGVKKHIAGWAFGVGEKTIPHRLAGRPLPPLLKAQYAVAQKLVFSKLQERLGGRMRFMVSGSAKLNADVQRWFLAAGLKVIEGYGMTETAAVSFVDTPESPNPGTVGAVVPGSQVRIADDGEVLMKGPAVMRGYHNRPDLDAEVFSDGWFHTGDIGRLDEAGRLMITDRKKDLIKTSGGKYVAPQKVEGAVVAACPYISQVIIHGEQRKYVTALLTLDPEAISAWAAEQPDTALASLTPAELATHPAVIAMVQEHIDRANEELERWETIKRFAILEKELSLEDGHVTPSLKIKRRTVEAAHRALLDSLYDEEA